MCQFDDYINSILKDLKISKNEKKELAEEFLDHLLMLKQEYLSKGLTESDAVKQAMNSFGKENALKRKLSYSYLNYRSFLNIFTGIILFLMLFRIGAFIPMPGLSPADNIFVRVFKLSMSTIILFMPMGYFLPIFFKQKKTILITVLISTAGLILLNTYTFCSFNKFLLKVKSNRLSIGYDTVGGCKYNCCIHRLYSRFCLIATGS
jgi:hypothetical protein